MRNAGGGDSPVSSTTRRGCGRLDLQTCDCVERIEPPTLVMEDSRGRCTHEVHDDPASGEGALHLSNEGGGEGDFLERVKGDVGTSSHQESVQVRRSSPVLCETIPSLDRGQEAPRLRSCPPESLPDVPFIPSGRGEGGIGGGFSRRLVRKNRYKEGLLAYTRGKKLQKVCSVSGRGGGVRGYFNASRSRFSPLYLPCVNVKGGCNLKRGKPSPILFRRRLAGNRFIQGRGRTDCTENNLETRRTRILPQRCKDDEGSPAEGGIFRTDVRCGFGFDIGSVKEAEGPGVDSKEDDGEGSNYGTKGPESSGVVGFLFSGASKSVGPQDGNRAMEKRPSEGEGMGRAGNHIEKHDEGVEVVVGGEERDCLFSDVERTSGRDGPDGCRTVRLGSNLVQKWRDMGRTRGCLWSARRAAKLKRAGAESTEECAEDESKVLERHSFGVDDRQRGSGTVRAQDSREVRPSSQAGEASERTLVEVEDIVVDKTGEGYRNSGGGSPFQTERSSRLDDSRSMLGTDCREVGNTTVRSIRVKILDKGGELRVQSARFECSLDGRLRIKLGRLEPCVCIPTTKVSLEDGKEDNHGWGSRGDSNSSLCGRGVDTFPGEDNVRCDLNTMGSSAGHNREECGDPSSSVPGVWPSIFSPLKLVDSNPSALDARVGELIRSSMDKSTIARRSKNWMRFVEYVGESGTISPEAVASFLAKSFYESDLSAGALASLRSDISVSLKVMFNKDWSENTIISKVVEAVTKLKRPAPKYLSMWDIDRLKDYYMKGEQVTSIIGLRQRAIVLVRASLAARSKDVWAIARHTVKFSQDEVRFRFFSWKNRSIGEKSLSSEYEIQFLVTDLKRRCAATALKEYMQAVGPFYSDEHGAKHDVVWVFWNSGKSLKAKTVASDSKKVMEAIGIDTTVFGPATIRHAAISKWHELGVPREVVARRTGHRSLNVISFYYDKSVVRDLDASLELELGSLDKNSLEEESDEEF